MGQRSDSPVQSSERVRGRRVGANFRMKTLSFAIFLLTVSCNANGKSKPAIANGGPVPEVFLSALAEAKAKTSLPVLLPTELPSLFSDAKHAVTEKLAADEYAISLYYELDVGDAGFAASFAGDSKGRYSPQEIPNVRAVKLAHGLVGFFRPVSCGGSCAPANLWWKQAAVLYQIQLRLPSQLREKKQQRIITEVANSAILAGPR